MDMWQEKLFTAGDAETWRTVATTQPSLPWSRDPMHNTEISTRAISTTTGHRREPYHTTLNEEWNTVWTLKRSNGRTCDEYVNLPDITSKFGTGAMFVIVSVQTIHTKIVRTFTIYLHTKFHSLNSTGSLVIAIKQEVNYTLRTVAMLLFHFIKKSTSTKRASNSTVNASIWVSQAGMFLLMVNN
jgi:hypothetical protein